MIRFLCPLYEAERRYPCTRWSFSQKHSTLNERSLPTISQEATHVLMNYNWRENVRELENVIERALLLCNEEIQRQLCNVCLYEYHLLNQSLAQATTSAIPVSN